MDIYYCLRLRVSFFSFFITISVRVHIAFCRIKYLKSCVCDISQYQNTLCKRPNVSLTPSNFSFCPPVISENKTKVMFTFKCSPEKYRIADFFSIQSPLLRFYFIWFHCVVEVRNLVGQPRRIPRTNDSMDGTCLPSVQLNCNSKITKWEHFIITT